MSLAEIVERLDQISQVWRSDTSAEQRLDRSRPHGRRPPAGDPAAAWGFGHRTGWHPAGPH